MTESPNLLPCPFCGNKEPAESPPGCGVVYCDECGARTVQAGWWSRRAPDPEREAMARVCEAAAGLDRIITGTVIHLVSVRSVDMAKDVVRHKAAVQNALADLERARKGGA